MEKTIKDMLYNCATKALNGNKKHWTFHDNIYSNRFLVQCSFQLNEIRKNIQGAKTGKLLKRQKASYKHHKYNPHWKSSDICCSLSLLCIYKKNTHNLAATTCVKWFWAPWFFEIKFRVTVTQIYTVSHTKILNVAHKLYGLLYWFLYFLNVPHDVRVHCKYKSSVKISLYLF